METVLSVLDLVFRVSSILIFTFVMVVLNEKQFLAYHLIELGHNVVILGQAGTGKSILIRETQSRLLNRGCPVDVVASTGIASSQFPNGKTLHSWAGLQDGYLEGTDLLNSIVQQKDTADGIRKTDLLIVDEASMISAKRFDKLEYVCCMIRGGITYFGGLRIVCVGDWFQLPPVPNNSANDPGKCCFESHSWKAVMKHKITLTDVVKQTDQKLVTSINELERGVPSDATNIFMKGLSRSLPDGKRPTYLYADNLQVDIHNAQELNKLPGHFTVYRSTDTGRREKLDRVLAKESLFLKLNCPVLLIRNLWRGLVNGSRGTLTRLEDDGPTVTFQNCTVKLEKKVFSVYNPVTKANDAERLQYPLTPAYSLTIHKAQGLTLPRVVVNCRNIFTAGQLGVAVGRAVSTDGLQVLNYSPKNCKRHPEEVYHFAEEPGQPPLEDFCCCQHILFVDDISDGDSQVVFPDSGGSDCDDDDLEKIAKWEGESVLEAQTTEAFSDGNSQVVFPDSGGSDYDDSDLEKIAKWEGDSVLEAQTSEALHSTHSADSQAQTFKAHVASRYTESETLQVLDSLLSQKAITPEQIRLNTSISYLKTDPRKVKYSIVICCSFGNSVTMEKVLKLKLYFCRNFTATLAHKLMSSPRSVDKLLCGSIITYLRKSVCVTDSAQSQEPCTAGGDDMKTSGEEATIPTSAYCKIRYVGGFSAAKMKFHYRKLVHTTLYSHCVLDTWSKIKTDLLQSQIVSHDEIMKTTKYPESLTEMSRKQNLTCGLTDISDGFFQFFLFLEKK